MLDKEPVLSRPLRLLVDGVAAVRAQRATELPGPQALAETAVLLGELDRLRVVVLGRVADVDTRGLHALDAAPTTSSWLQSQSGSLDRSAVALARRLPGLPALARVVHDGVLSVEVAELVARSVEDLRRHVDLPDGRIDGHDGEQVLANVVVEGVLFQLAEARGGYDDDDPELHALVQELVGIWRAPQTQLDRLERALVLLAARIDRPLLRQALDRLVDAVLPQQLEDAAARGHAQRGLKLTLKSDGSGYTLARSELDLECGAYLEAVLAAMRAIDPDNPADTASWAWLRHDETRHDETRHDRTGQDQSGLANGGQAGLGQLRDTTGNTAGDENDEAGLAGPADESVEADESLEADESIERGEAGESGDGALFGDTTAEVTDPVSAPAPRSRTQQDHDAFKLALRQLLDGGALGTRDKVAPHLTITVSHDALHDQPGALPATTSTGTALPAGLVRRLLCDSAITRAVLSLGRRVLEISHTERTLKAHERRALHLRWGNRCAGAGCTHPTGIALIPHHANPWHKTGTTSLDDSIPFCRSTHRDLHAGKTIRLRDGRYLGPDGWTDGPDG